MLNKFKELVDNVDISITEEEPNIENRLSDVIKVQIENLNSTEGVINKSTFYKLNAELIYRQIILNENSNVYLNVIKLITDRMSSEKKFPNLDNDDWKLLIKSCKNYLNFKEVIDEEYLKTYHTEEFNRAQSVKYLIDKGCEIKIEEDNITFIKGLKEVLKELEYKIEKFGGINLIIGLSNMMDYNPKFKRFIFKKQTVPLHINEQVEIPYGYLFNLALKYPKIRYNTKKIKTEKLFKEIIDLSSKIINAVYNIQEYNIFNHIFQNEKTVPQNLSNLVLYDSLFRIPQGNMDLELKLCKCFFSFKGDFFEKTFGFSLDNFLLVMKDLKNISLNNKNGVYKVLSKKGKYCLPYKEYHKILNFMSYDKINEEYFYPNNYSKVDFFKKPIIKLNNNHFFIPSISIISPNFYELLVDKLRDPYNKEFKKNLNELLGKKLEILIKALFDEYKINYISNSKYSNKEYTGETDFIIESTKSIIIIEVKKKSLRGESKSGHDYRIFMDLFASLVKSQFQANKLEYSLKKFGEVELKLENASKYKLVLNNREVKRISLTQLEYGSLYNHYSIENFLKMLFNNEFDIVDSNEETKKDFDKLKRIVPEYESSYIKLDEISHDNYFKSYSFCTYFMSLSQLFEVIKESYDNNSFCENLPSQFFESGTLDWYFEYDKHLNSINTSKKK